MLDTYLLTVKVQQANSVSKLRYEHIPYLFGIVLWYIYGNTSSKSFNEEIWNFFKIFKRKQFHHIIKTFWKFSKWNVSLSNIFLSFCLFVCSFGRVFYLSCKDIVSSNNGNWLFIDFRFDCIFSLLCLNIIFVNIY